jgi:GWxTD domain-containing protein
MVSFRFSRWAAVALLTAAITASLEVVVVGTGTAAMAPGALAPARQEPVLTFARFWREGATLLETIVGLPVSTSAMAGERNVALSVRDSADRVLYETTWTDSVSARTAGLARQREGVEVTARFAVALRPGTYEVTVRVADGAEAASVEGTVQAFEQPPLISDVLLGSAMRLLEEGQESTDTEIRKGQYAIERGTRVKLLPARAELWYYLELYAPAGSAAIPVELEFAIARVTGGAPLVTMPRSIQLSAPGAVDAAMLDLAGLPPGDYRLVVTASARGETQRREADFTVASFEQAPIIAAQPVATPAATETGLLERYFAPSVRDSTAIHTLVEALTLAPPGERVDASRLQLDTDAQRRFLAYYWARHDNSPGTVENPLLEEYLQRVQFVAREYAERDIGRAGTRTDRGRIYLKYGAPEEKLNLPMPQNRAVEVWRYRRGRPLKFAFLDETGFEHFNLIMTTDPQERTLPDWQERVRDPGTVRLILSF